MWRSKNPLMEKKMHGSYDCIKDEALNCVNGISKSTKNLALLLGDCGYSNLAYAVHNISVNSDLVSQIANTSNMVELEGMERNHTVRDISKPHIAFTNKLDATKINIGWAYFVFGLAGFSILTMFPFYQALAICVAFGAYYTIDKIDEYNNG